MKSCHGIVSRFSISDSPKKLLSLVFPRVQVFSRCILRVGVGGWVEDATDVSHRAKSYFLVTKNRGWGYHLKNGKKPHAQAAPDTRESRTPSSHLPLHNTAASFYQPDRQRRLAGSRDRSRPWLGPDAGMHGRGPGGCTYHGGDADAHLSHEGAGSCHSAGGAAATLRPDARSLAQPHSRVDR